MLLWVLTVIAVVVVFGVSLRLHLSLYRYIDWGFGQAQREAAYKRESPWVEK
jgi:hypothetical protein